MVIILLLDINLGSVDLLGFYIKKVHWTYKTKPIELTIVIQWFLVKYQRIVSIAVTCGVQGGLSTGIAVSVFLYVVLCC